MSGSTLTPPLVQIFSKRPRLSAPLRGDSIQPTVVGSYPRIGGGAGGQRLRRAITRHDRGEIAPEDLRKVEVEVLQEIVREQASAGVDVVTDGQVTWHDAPSHFAARLEGFEIGALERYFDTNTYYRRPKAKGKVRWVNPITVDDWLAASSASPTPVKAVVTGPYTLATLSANGASSDLLWALAEALGNEVNALAHAGASRIQIDEPALTRGKVLPKGYDELAATLLHGKGRAKTTLFTYFGGVGPFLDDITALPFDFIGLDLVQGAGTLDVLRRSHVEKPLVLGLIDARNTRMEDPRAVAKIAASLADRIPLDHSYLSPSNGLEFLPREKAREKLEILVTAGKLVEEVRP